MIKTVTEILSQLSESKVKKIDLKNILRIISITWKIPGKKSNPSFFSKKRQMIHQKYFVSKTIPLLICKQLQILLIVSSAW